MPESSIPPALKDSGLTGIAAGLARGNRLTLELISHIVHFLKLEEDGRSLIGLQGCNKELHHAVTPMIYRRITISPNTARSLFPSFPLAPAKGRPGSPSAAELALSRVFSDSQVAFARLYGELRDGHRKRGDHPDDFDPSNPFIDVFKVLNLPHIETIFLDMFHRMIILNVLQPLFQKTRFYQVGGKMRFCDKLRGVALRVYPDVYRINRAEATVEVFEILASQACSPVDLCFQGPLGGFDIRCQGGPFEYYRSLRKDLVSSVTYHSVASTLGCRPCQTGGRQMRLIYAPGPESTCLPLSHGSFLEDLSDMRLYHEEVFRSRQRFSIEAVLPFTTTFTATLCDRSPQSDQNNDWSVFVPDIEEQEVLANWIKVADATTLGEAKFAYLWRPCDACGVECPGPQPEIHS